MTAGPYHEADDENGAYRLERGHNGEGYHGHQHVVDEGWHKTEESPLVADQRWRVAIPCRTA